MKKKISTRLPLPCHSMIKREYGLMATEEEKAVVQFHRIELPRIHQATLESFEHFRAFLLRGV